VASAGVRRTPLRSGAAICAFAILTLGAGLLSLGPTIHVAGQALLRGPYLLLYRYVPGFSGVRVPGRFAVLVMLGVAVLAAAGAGRLLERLRPRRRAGVVLALLVLIALEYASFPWPSERVEAAGPLPAVYPWLAAQPGDFAVVELPIDVYPAFEHDIRYIGCSTRHWKRLVNGYSGYFPTGYLALTGMLQAFPDAGSLRTLSRLGVRYAIVHRDLFSAAQLAAFDAAAAQNGREMSLVDTFGDAQVFALRQTSEVSETSEVSLGVAETRPFLLKGWSPNDDRHEGVPFVWNEGDEAALLLPAWAPELRTLSIVARSQSGDSACRVQLDGKTLGDLVFGETGTATHLLLPAPASRGLHRLQWRCRGGKPPATPRAIGQTGVAAPADLALTVAGADSGDYADLYAAGKRYNVERACRSCAGLVALRAGDPNDLLWQTFDMAAAEGREALSATLDALPAGSILLFAARGAAALPADVWAGLARYGGAGLERLAGSAYLLLGVRGAPAGSAVEAACAESCWRYLGQPWPARRLAVERVELTP